MFFVDDKNVCHPEPLLSRQRAVFSVPNSQSRRPPLRKRADVRPRRRRSAERSQNGRHDRTRMRPAAACAVRRGFSYIRLLPSDGKTLVRNPYPARLSAHSRFPVLRIHPVWRLHTAHLFTRSHVLPLRKTSYPPTCSARLSAYPCFPILRNTSRPPTVHSLAFLPFEISILRKTTHPPTVSGAAFRAFACPVLWEAYPPYPPRPFFHTAPAASFTETLKPAAVC